MPVSTPVHISHCLERIIGLNPESVLDVGCGFGLWGFLCREYLDVWNGRVEPAQWKVRIDGTELFEPYIQAHQRALYTHVFVGDVRDTMTRLGDYDLIIDGDVIEHLEKVDGEAVLDCLYDKARKALLVNLPLGEGWDHPEAHGNPGELHRSQWRPEDLVQYPSEATGFDLYCGKYGVFWCSKDCQPALRVQGLQVAAELRESRGDTSGARRYLQQAHDLDPGHEEVAMRLADLLLQRGEMDSAIDVLRGAVAIKPDFFVARLLAARILAIAHRHVEAREELSVLANQEHVPDEILSQAQELSAELRKAL